MAFQLCVFLVFISSATAAVGAAFFAIYNLGSMWNFAMQWTKHFKYLSWMAKRG